jgi:TRAP-type C4-dicarboxylate transport system permease small subunit
MNDVSVLSRAIYAASRFAAWIGGAVLCALAVMSVISIAGRALSGLGLKPVPGDFELVEVGTALAVFCFLPWCHLKRGHAVVDLFWNHYPRPMQRVLDVSTELLTVVVWVLLTWRMGVAMLDYRANGETSFILGMPVWWGYAISMPPAILGCIAYICRFAESLGVLRAPAGFETATGEH